MAEDLNYHIIPETGKELNTAFHLWDVLYDINRNIYSITIDEEYPRLIAEIKEFETVTSESVKDLVSNSMSDKACIALSGGKLNSFYFYGKSYQGGLLYQSHGCMRINVAIKNMLDGIKWNDLDPFLTADFDYHSENYLDFISFFLKCCGCKIDDGFDKRRLLNSEQSFLRLDQITHSFCEAGDWRSPLLTSSVFHVRAKDYILDFLMVYKSYKEGMKLGLAYANSDTLVNDINNAAYHDPSCSYLSRPYVYDQMFAKSKEDIQAWILQLDPEKILNIYQNASNKQIGEAIRISAGKVQNMRFFELHETQFACVHDPTFCLDSFYYHLWNCFAAII